jgi:hypothetical protein
VTQPKSVTRAFPSIQQHGENPATTAQLSRSWEEQGNLFIFSRCTRCFSGKGQISIYLETLFHPLWSRITLVLLNPVQNRPTFFGNRRFHPIN